MGVHGIYDFLCATPLFLHFNETQLKELSAYFEECTFPSQAKLVCIGQPVEEFFVITQGEFLIHARILNPQSSIPNPQSPILNPQSPLTYPTGSVVLSVPAERNGVDGGSPMTSNRIFGLPDTAIPTSELQESSTLDTARKGVSESCVNLMDGGETVLTTKKAGACVGHVGIVGDSKEWSHSVTAKTDVSVLILRKQKLDR